MNDEKADISVSMTHEERQAAYKKSEDAWKEAVRKEHEKGLTISEARRGSGMGFWRLVWIVAFGILIAQLIGGLFLWIVSSIKTP